MTLRPRFFFALLSLLISVCSAALFDPITCRGAAKYEVKFENFLTPNWFGQLIPPDGLVFSPLAGVSHSNRVSLLTVRSFASEPFKAIAETGDNGPLVKVAKSLRGSGVKTVTAAKGPTMPGESTTLTLTVDCKNPFITVLGMVAPSPDWIMQISNVNLFHSSTGEFIRYDAGYLIAYDAGTDSGGDFTDPADKTLDIPTDPPLIIAPLHEDETNPFPFERRLIGGYTIKKIS